ncbi:MAG: tetratricopeptide repeat protein [candidate division WOR-3 bacterium]
MRRFPKLRRLLPLFALLFSLPALAQNIPLDALLRGGRIHYDGQRFERAKEQFQKALDQYGSGADNSTLAQIHTWLGLCEAQLRNFSAAAEHFAVALETDSAYAAKIRKDEQWQYYAWTALINRTRDELNADQAEAALRYARAALQVDPAKSQNYTLLANAYSTLGRHEEMRSVADQLLKLDAGAAEAYGLLGLYFLQKPDSLWPTPEARTARWDSAVYYYNRAISQYEKRFNDAKATLAQKLKLTDPARLNEVTWRLVALSRNQDQSELKRYIEKDLAAGRQLVDIAALASQLFFSANNLNVASARAGTAMLRAAAETKGPESERFRSQAETLFSRAVEYDSTDFTALFDLGIAQYQAGKDAQAEQSLQRVIDGAIVSLGLLPETLADELLALITPTVAQAGYVQLAGPVAARTDSVLSAQGRPAVGYNWLYCPDLKQKQGFVAATRADLAGMFLSVLPPQLLEQVYLWLGSSQTGLASALDPVKDKEARRAKFIQAIANLELALKLNPKSADAYQNLGICFRETDQKERALAAFEAADRLRKGR